MNNIALVGLLVSQCGKAKMTVKQLIEILEKCDGDKVAVCSDEHGGWDNIEQVREDDGVVSIEFGGGSPFSDE